MFKSQKVIGIHWVIVRINQEKEREKKLKSAKAYQYLQKYQQNDNISKP